MLHHLSSFFLAHCANTRIDDHEPEEETESRPQTEAEIGDEQLVLGQEDHQI